MAQMAQLFHDFVTELKKLSLECLFKTLHDPLIRDRIKHDTNDNSLRERLRESELTLPKPISAGHTAAETHTHAHEIHEVKRDHRCPQYFKTLKSRGQTHAQAKEIIKKILTTVVNILPMEKFAVSVIGKTILTSAVHVIEKLSKLNHLLLTNTNFSLIQ